MPAMQFKLSKPGGLTRRLTLPEQSSWLVLATRIETLFGIAVEKVAVAYTDADGDEVTLSSQEELIDYYAHCHKAGEAVKFKVIDLSSTRSARGESVTAEERSDDGTEVAGLRSAGLGNLGPTLMFEVDDEWQHMPRLPNLGLFQMQDDLSTSELHAFVETVESDVTGDSQLRNVAIVHSNAKSASNAGDLMDFGNGDIAGKGKGRQMDEATTFTQRTSEASMVEAETPKKPDVHIYDVADAGNMSPRTFAAATPVLVPIGLDDDNEPRFSAFGIQVESATDDKSDNESISSLSTVTTTPASPLVDLRPEIGKPLPKTPSLHSNPVFPQQSAPPTSVHTTPRQAPIVTLASPREQASTPVPPTNAPSVVNDVANLLDALTTAFASHPELSEGLRNIVRNSIGGAYWSSDRDRIVNAANDMRRTAEEMSERATYVLNESDAGRRVAEALGGVFRVIGDLSSGISNLSSTSQGVQSSARNVGPAGPQAQARNAVPPPMPGGWPRPFGAPLPNPYGQVPPPPPFFGGRHYTTGRYPPPPPPFFTSAAEHTFGYNFAPPLSPMAPSGPAAPTSTENTAPRSTDDSALPPQERQFPVRIRDQMMNVPQRSNTWSGGRRMYAEPSAPGYRPSYSYGQGVGELDQYNLGHESKVQLEAAKAFYREEKERFRREKEERRRVRREAAEKKAEEGNASATEGREETIVARIPLPSPKGKGAGASKRSPYAEIYSISPAKNVATTPATAPAVASSSRHAGIPMLSDRVVGRLYEMGFSTETHPNMLTVLNEQLYPNGEPTRLNEEQILIKTLGALHIRGSPSPRASGSGLPLR